MNNLQQKFRAFEEELNEVALERQEEIRGILSALLGKQMVFLLGKPGTGKNWILESVFKRVKKGNYFQTLMTKYSTPESICGPASLMGMKQDQFYRITDGMLPQAHFAFLDEVWNAADPILLTLNNILCERVFYNGTRGKEPVPLLTGVFASNTTPTSPDTQAIYDRIALRFSVSPIIESHAAFDAIIAGMTRPPDFVGVSLTLTDIKKAQEAVAEIEIPESVRELIRAIDLRANAEGLGITARRHRQIGEVVKAQAWLAGRKKADKTDLLLPYTATLWKHQNEIEKARELVETVVAPALKEARDALREIRRNAKEFYDRVADDTLESSLKTSKTVIRVRKLFGTYNKLLEDAPEEEKALVSNVRTEAQRVYNEMRDAQTKLEGLY
jgi:MoxR-like ATPase